MAGKKQFAGIDAFRLAAAFMVIAIHTSPFSVWNETADFLFSYCLCRIAVPFFLMTTGYFVLGPYIFGNATKKRRLEKYLVKNTALYLAVTFLYLPLSLYAGNFPKSAGEGFRNFFFDGTFYHLWYFPAAVTGCILIVLFARKSLFPAVIFSGAAYVIGVFGDSCYGMIKDVPGINAVYEGIFSFSSYTRNGIFFAPLFLLMGAALARPAFCAKSSGKEKTSRFSLICGMVFSAGGMFLEGFFTYSRDLQKHNSMYFFLIPLMYFLFRLLLLVPGRVPLWIRKSTMPVYILHPAVLVGVRGMAKAMGKTEIFVENTFVCYLLVCGISFVLAVLLQKMFQYSLTLFRLEDME